jgi:hypothetical protein
MAASIMFRAPGKTRDAYDKVNQVLGLDPATGGGDWPEGLLSHAAGEADGALYVFEVWESRDAQQRWMNGQLGRAFQESGAILEPPEITWVDLFSYYRPGRTAGV